MGLGERRVEKHGAPKRAGTNEGTIPPEAGEDRSFVDAADQADRR
jgi:hypothetical protein